MANFLVSHCIWRLFCWLFPKNTNLAVLLYFFMGPLMLVNLSWFLCDPNDSAKFRSSRRELWGTFPSVVPISKKASDPALQAENGPLSSRMGTFQRRRSIKVLSGYGCELWYVPTELGLPGPKKWGYCRRCLTEQLISGPKKDHVGKIGS